MHEALLDARFELFVVGRLERVLGTEAQRAVVERLLHLCEQLLDALGQSVLRNKRLAFAPRHVAARECDCAFLNVARAQLDAQGHALDFPLVELEARRQMRAVVQLPTKTRALDFSAERARWHEGHLAGRGVSFN